MNNNKFSMGISFHQGRTVYDIARTYPNLLRVLLEVVQNGIDAGATRIEVDVSIPQKSFKVYDNGCGCGKEKFQKALHSLNATMKEKDKYGQFGKGLVAPGSVASRFEFTSCPTPRKDGYCVYSFDMLKIKAQEVVEIPGEEVRDLEFDPSGKTWWRTSVVASKLTKDRVLTSISELSLRQEIGLKFGEAIRTRSIVIKVTVVDESGERRTGIVEAPEFTGTKLPTFETSGRDAGKVTMEFYIARLSRKGRKGNVIFKTMDNPSLVSVEQFVDSTRRLLDPVVAKNLTSGLFEGKISCEKIKLHPERDRFEEDDALVELCDHVEKWFEKEGNKIVAEAKEKDTDDRLTRVSLSVIPFANLLLRQSRFQSIANSIEVGTIGPDHSKVKKSQILGPDEGKSLATLGYPDEDPKKRQPHTETDPKVRKERPGQQPGTVYTVKGKKRTEVQGNSTGMRFALEEMENIRIPFEFDTRTCTLTFNTDHPNWSACQDKNACLAKYQIAVVGTALSLEMFRIGKTEIHPETLEFAYQKLSEETFAILNGEAMLTKLVD